MGKVLVPKGFDPKFTRHWFLVANRVEARVYEGTPETLRFVKRLANPKGRLTELQLIADRPGRKFSSSRSGVRHGFEPKSYYHEVVAAQFARRIGKMLERAQRNGEFSDLVVLAEPHFLGLLNQAFAPSVRQKVTKEIGREWSEGSDRDLGEYLQKKLA